jgi:hypothetical protein
MDARAVIEEILAGPPATIVDALVELVVRVATQAARQGVARGLEQAERRGPVDWKSVMSSTPNPRFGIVDLVHIARMTLDALAGARDQAVKTNVIVSVLGQALDLRRDADVAVLIEEAQRLETDIGLLNLTKRFPYMASSIASTGQALRFGAALVQRGMLPGSLVQPGSSNEDGDGAEPNEEPPQA